MSVVRGVVTMNKKMLVVVGIIFSIFSPADGAEALFKQKKKDSSKKISPDKKIDKVKVPSLDLKKSDGGPKRAKTSNGPISGGTPKVKLDSVNALESYVKEGRAKTNITSQSGEGSSSKK